jgi:hypothetical protein
MAKAPVVLSFGVRHGHFSRGHHHSISVINDFDVILSAGVRVVQPFRVAAHNNIKVVDY